MQKRQQPSIAKIRTDFIVPHRNASLTYVFPIANKDDYSSVGWEILSRKLKVPTGDDTSSLVHSVFCNPKLKDDTMSKSVRGMLYLDGLWVFNKQLWTPQGVYVYQDKEVKEERELPSKKELEKMLKDGRELTWGGIRFSKDERVRFVPRGSYKLGKHTPKSLAKDGLIIANYNLMGAEQLGEVAQTIRKPSFIVAEGLDMRKGCPEHKVSLLYLSADHNLCLDVFSGGNNFCGETSGACALGIRE